jgi:hypothetical protein
MYVGASRLTQTTFHFLKGQANARYADKTFLIEMQVLEKSFKI